MVVNECLPDLVPSQQHALAFYYTKYVMSLGDESAVHVEFY